MVAEKKMTRSRLVQVALGLILFALTGFFFAREFSKNWEGIKATAFALNLPLLVSSFILIVLSYLVNTKAWCRGINLYSPLRPFSFSDGIGMVNTTQLTKYIPGKVWGYAMQVVLVDRKSVPPANVIYINLFIAISNVFVSAVMGTAYLLFVPSVVPLSVSAALFSLSALGYASFLIFNGKFVRLVLRLAELILRRTISPCEIPVGTMLALQGYSLLNVALFGCSAVLCAAGLGFAVSAPFGIALAIGSILADAVGFIMIFAPGGIGIREGLLYLLLRAQGPGIAALTVPVALRIVSMLVDVALGLTGLMFLRRYANAKRGER
jgi:hypothetical protein